MHIASHTPSNPIDGASNAAIGRRTNHMLEKFMAAGTIVSPTPTITP